MSKNTVNVAIAGVGNATSAFVQSLLFYGNNPEKSQNLTFPMIGGLSIDSIKIVAAFDVSVTKVGKKVSEAIFAEPNVTPKYVDPAELEQLSLTVLRGPLLDGINKTVEKIVTVDDETPEVNVAEELRKAKAEVLINLIPSGADEATYAYAQAALDAGCAFVNATPTQVATLSDWAQKFKKAGIPLVGDDLQSHVGGTRIHKGIMELLNTFGARVVHTYQLDVSGGAEGLTTLDSSHRMRLMKSAIKTESIQRAHPGLSNDDIASGTTDYLDFLGNQRIGHFWIKSKDFLDGEIHIDITVKSFDGPNAAGTLVDVVRATKVALLRAVEGQVISVSAYGFKNPPVYAHESEANSWFREFIDARRMV